MPLPGRLLLRRADEAPVIGAALAVAARGRGHWRIAAEVVAAVSAGPVPLEPAGSPLADALVAIVAAVAAERWPGLLASTPRPAPCHFAPQRPPSRRRRLNS